MGIHKYFMVMIIGLLTSCTTVLQVTPKQSIVPSAVVASASSTPSTLPTAVESPPSPGPQAPLRPDQLRVVLDASKLSPAMQELATKTSFEMNLYAAPLRGLDQVQTLSYIFQALTGTIDMHYVFSNVPNNQDLSISLYYSYPQGTFTSYCGERTELKPLYRNLPLTGQPFGQVTLDLEEKYDPFPCLRKEALDGTVFDDNNTPIEDVKITVRALSTEIKYQAETQTDKAGKYRFYPAPVSEQVEITAGKAGYYPRKRVEVIKMDDFNPNRYDFGTDNNWSRTGSLNNALSTKPEIIQVSPNRNAQGIDPRTDIRLTFSHPMETQSVEKAFTIRAFEPIKLTVDEGAKTPTFNGQSTISTLTNSLIWDKDAVNFSWNPEHTEVTASFKADTSLPTNRDIYNMLRYQVVLQNPITSKAGVNRPSSPFKLTDGPFEESCIFAIKAETTAPEVQAVDAQPDAIQVTFNEPMMLQTLTRMVAGGMADLPETISQAPAAYPSSTNITERNTAKNYTVTLTTPMGLPVYTGHWFSLGGIVNYLSPRSVELTLPKNTSGIDIPHFNTGTIVVNGAFQTDSIANSTGFGEYRLALFKPDGTRQIVETVVKPADQLPNNAALATDLQNKLNQAVYSLAFNPFHVSSTNAPNPSFRIAFEDPTGKYLGWTQIGFQAGTAQDNLPNFAETGLFYTNGQPLPLLKAGYQVQVTVAKTIVDPAGNPMNPEKCTSVGFVR